MELKSGIYKITNKVNGKIYIGKSINLQTRKSHFFNFNNKVYGGDLINRARQKYNSEKYWNYEVLEYCLEDIINEREMFYISLYDTFNTEYGYNLTKGGEGQSGLVMSDEQKKKIGDAQLGEKNHMYGKTQSEEVKNILSLKNSGENNSMFGKTHSEEVKNILRSKKSIPVLQIELGTNKIIKEWESAKVASIELNIVHSNISKCCKGKCKSAGGFKWCYKDNQELSNYQTKERTTRKNKIYQIDIETNEIIKEFDSIKNASDVLNICTASISSCCRGITNKAGNFKFCYVEDYEDKQFIPYKRSKSVQQIDIHTDEVIKVWDSIKDICDNLQCRKGGIIACCNNMRRTSFGYKWKYVS